MQDFSKTKYPTLSKKLSILQGMNQKRAMSFPNSMLRSELMRNKVNVTDSMKILAYIDSELTQFSKTSKVYARWISDVKIMGNDKKQKALLKVGEEERAFYEKMPTALEIRTRIRYKDRSVEYQTLKLGIEYNKWLFKYIDSIDSNYSNKK